MYRRAFLIGAAGAALAAAARWNLRDAAAESEETKPMHETFEVRKTDAEWRQSLTPQQYDVLRQHGTERPWTSPLNDEHREGTFVCAACGLPLYSSKAKFDSGTGWPSFYEPLPDAVRTSVDKSWFTTRTEVHCRRCGGHLGHVFEDGPPPTGLRYCMNGVAMKFIPAKNAPS